MADKLISDAKKVLSGDAKLLSGDELARVAFLISMGTVGAFIAVVFVFIIL